MTADELRIKFLRCYIAELAGFAPTIGHVIESNNVDSAAAAKKLKTLYAEADELTQKKVEQTFNFLLSDLVCRSRRAHSEES